MRILCIELNYYFLFFIIICFCLKTIINFMILDNFFFQIRILNYQTYFLLNLIFKPTISYRIKFTLFLILKAIY
jgi:hypothetical protein